MHVAIFGQHFQSHRKPSKSDVHAGDQCHDESCVQGTQPLSSFGPVSVVFASASSSRPGGFFGGGVPGGRVRAEPPSLFGPPRGDGPTDGTTVRRIWSKRKGFEEATARGIGWWCRVDPSERGVVTVAPKRAIQTENIRLHGSNVKPKKAT